MRHQFNSPADRDEVESRKIRDTDRFLGYSKIGDVPSLFGLQRSILGVWSLNAPWIDRVRRLPQPTGALLSGILLRGRPQVSLSLVKKIMARRVSDDQFLSTAYLGARALRGSNLMIYSS